MGHNTFELINGKKVDFEEVKRNGTKIKIVSEELA